MADLREKLQVFGPAELVNMLTICRLAKEVKGGLDALYDYLESEVGDKAPPPVPLSSASRQRFGDGRWSRQRSPQPLYGVCPACGEALRRCAVSGAVYCKKCYWSKLEEE